MKRLLVFVLVFVMLFSAIGTVAGSSKAESALDSALNVSGGELHFTNDEKYPWVSKGTYAVSGSVGAGKSRSVVSLEPGIVDAGVKLSFKWRVSCEASFDFLAFYVNGVKQASITGNIASFSTYGYVVQETGEYKFEWKYEKDSYNDEYSDMGFLASVCFTSPDALRSIAIACPSPVLMPGDSQIIKASAIPATAYTGKILWTSSDESIATVDENGSITAISYGEALITATSQLGFTATTKVKVIEGLCAYSYLSSKTENGLYLTDIMNKSLSHIVTLDNMPYAMEYAKGFIYASAYNGNKSCVYKINARTLKYSYKEIPVLFYDMTYDETTGKIFAIADGASDRALYEFDFATGEAIIIDEISGMTNLPLTLAADDAGVLYSVTLSDGKLYTIDKETGDSTLVGATGLSANYVQSMSFDKTTGELYWASCVNTINNGICTVNRKTAQITPIYSKAGNMTSLFFCPTALEPGETGLAGDVNLDGSVTQLDALLLLRYLALWKAIKLDEKVVDLSGDAVVTNLDALLMLRKLAGWKIF